MPIPDSPTTRKRYRFGSDKLVSHGTLLCMSLHYTLLAPSGKMILSPSDTREDRLGRLPLLIAVFFR